MEHLQEAPKVSAWSRLGPVLLLGAFAILLFRNAPTFWPFILIAFVGYGATRLLGKAGLCLSLIALMGAVCFLSDPSCGWMWRLILACSIAASLLLVHLSGSEVEMAVGAKEEQIQALEQQRQSLEGKLREEAEALRLLQRQCLSEQEANARLQTEAQRMRQALQQMEEARQGLEKEKLHLQAQLAEAVSTEQKALPVEESGHEFALLKGQHALLREQFEEKSEMLGAARKELFKLEEVCFVLGQQDVERELAPPEQTLIRDLQGLEEECSDLQQQVVCLEELISSLLEPKKRAPAKKGAKAAK